MSLTQDAIDQLKKKREHHQKVLFAWHAGMKSALLYNPTHPSFLQAAQRLTGTLADNFKLVLELSILHMDGLFHIDEDFFIEESLTMFDLLHVLEEGKISRVLFLPGIRDEEAAKFLTYLSTLKGPVGVSERIFASEHVRVFPEVQKDLHMLTRKKSHQRITDAQSILLAWNTRTEAIFTKLLDEQTLSMAELSDPLDELIDVLNRNTSLFSITWALPRPESLHLDHAVRTMILSLFLGQELGYDTSLLKLLAVSALCHDIGRQFLPSELTTGHPLSPADVDFVRLHARDGASFLAGVQGIPTSVVRVALEHHIGFDGLGYPHLPSGLKAHSLAQIVGLADFISWQTVSEHYYHKPVSLHRLLRCVLRRSGTQFNPLLVKLLLPFFGLYPSGTRLRLKSGDQALVLEPNLRNIGRPAVVAANKEGKVYRWLAQNGESADGFVDSAKTILGVQKDIVPYLPLIPDVI